MRAAAVALFVFAVAWAGPCFAEPAARAIDPAGSKAEFSVQHLWVERVTGSVPVVRGSVTLEPGSLIPLRVSAVLDPTKIKTGEDDRDGVLQTPDWFDTKAFSEWTFASTAIAKTGPSSFTLDGDLTIHGVTQPARLEVTVTGSPEQPVFHAAGHLDRHAFGMKTTKLDPAIGERVDVTLEVKLAR